MSSPLYTGPVASSVTSIAYEMLCLGLTISKTFGHYREQRRVGMRTPLVKLLLHDGQCSLSQLSLARL